jgi:hypothetical protein
LWSAAAGHSLHGQISQIVRDSPFISLKPVGAMSAAISGDKASAGAALSTFSTL